MNYCCYLWPGYRTCPSCNGSGVVPYYVYPRPLPPPWQRPWNVQTFLADASSHAKAART